MPAILGQGNQLQSLFQRLSIRRTVETRIETHHSQAWTTRLALLYHAVRHLVVRPLFHSFLMENETVLVFEKTHPQSPFYRNTRFALNNPHGVRFDTGEVRIQQK